MLRCSAANPPEYDTEVTSMSATTADQARPHHGIGFREFVAMIAALMAVNALAIDTMLPALPQIGASLDIQNPNERQWIVTSYLLGFGAAQLVYGALADRYGRKRVLLAGLSIYTVFSVVSALATSFEMMMIARVAQGLGSAATRVLAVSIVRDCYSGRPMARVMSFSFLVFLAAPIIAPSIGQAIMLVAPWRAVFAVLALFCVCVMIWVTLRLPETLHPQDVTPLRLGRVLGSFRAVLTNRISIGYTLAMTLIMSALIGFINSAQQVFTDVFHTPRLFTTIFALIACFVGAASLVNARLVGRLGTRVLSHSALTSFIVVAIVHAGVALAGWETLLSFAILQSMTMFCFGLVGSNFGSMAMEPLGHLAGTASSAQGFISTFGSAMLGFWIGQQFDGTDAPLTLGFAVLGIGAMAIVLVTERGVLFRPTAAGISSSDRVGR
jgi:DHA1 family bicyclomycin/chloramphenicol resistance-like MFS transporter